MCSESGVEVQQCTVSVKTSMLSCGSWGKPIFLCKEIAKVVFALVATGAREQEWFQLSIEPGLKSILIELFLYVSSIQSKSNTNTSYSQHCKIDWSN